LKYIRKKAFAMRFIDTHTHLTAEEYQNTLHDVLQRSRQAGVDEWITVGTDLTDNQKAIDLCRDYPGMYCIVGVHPHESGKQPADYLAQLRQLATATPVRAIGEIGLDYHYDFAQRSTQRRVMQQQLNLAEELSLPVVIHCREAFDDCLALLDEWRSPAPAVVFHCFSGDREQAQAVLDRGFFISFAGTITFHNAHRLHEAAKYVPADRLFLETDCPYLSPEPKRKIKPNEPALLVHTAAKLAQLRGVALEEIAQVTMDNSRLFFKIE